MRFIITHLDGANVINLKKGLKFESKGWDFDL